MGKTTFVFNCEWIEAIADFEPAVRFEIYEAIMRYATTGQVSELSPVAKAVFFFIRKEMDFNRERYEQTVAKRKAAAQKRWAKKSAANSGKKLADNDVNEVKSAKAAAPSPTNVPTAEPAREAFTASAENNYWDDSEALAHEAYPASEAPKTAPKDSVDEILEGCPFPVSDTFRGIVADMQRNSARHASVSQPQQPADEEYITYEEHLRRKRLREQGVKI